jgi:hypothetical protein
MPTHVGPNISGEENLVFGYDLSDQKNSYLGEPTTNLANSDFLRTIQFHNQGGYNNAGTISDAPEKGEGWKKIKITDRGNNFRIAQFPYLIQTYGQTRTYSVEYDFGTTSGYFFYGDGSSGFGVLQDNGRKASARFTPPGESDWFQALFLGHNTPASGINDVIYYKNYQVEVKSHPTPYTSSSRSVTQGLIDVTGNETINLTNVSFDSNAQMVFDGTDDYLNVNTSLNSGNFTYETVMSVNNTTYPIFGAGYGTAGTTIQSYITSSGALINLYAPIGAGGWVYGSYSNLNGYVSVANQLRHIVVTNNGTTWQTYVDGSLVGNVTFYQPDTGTDVGVGRIAMQSASNLSTVVKMVKLYSRTLLSSEVLNNYNNIKRKYGI